MGVGVGGGRGITTDIDSNSIPAVRCPTVVSSSSYPMQPQGVCLRGTALALSDSPRRAGRCYLPGDAYIGGTQMKREREGEGEIQLGGWVGKQAVTQASKQACMQAQY